MHRFAGVVLVDRRGWVLLQERDEHPAIDPEKWGLAGGHVEEGEAFENAAYRELAEETGVLLTPGTLRLWEQIEVFHEAYDSLDAMQVFAAATDLTDDNIECHEGRRIVFVEPTAAAALELTASASIIVPAFLASDLYQELTTPESPHEQPT